MGTKKIIAVVGLPGSGKTEVIEYLIQKYSWPKVYFGEVTFDEIKRRGLEVNEANERVVREGLRAEFGRQHYASKVIEKIHNLEDSPIILVESLYDWAEYLLFKDNFKNDFFTVAVYASPKTRYRRLSTRTIRPLTEAEAMSRDHSQIENIFQAGPIAMADYTIINEGEGLAVLYGKIDEVIEKLNC
jgi:dephospho-CoA kinase